MIYSFSGSEKLKAFEKMLGFVEVISFALLLSIIEIILSKKDSKNLGETFLYNSFVYKISIILSLNPMKNLISFSVYKFLLLS